MRDTPHMPALDRHRDVRRRAIALIDAELDVLRARSIDELRSDAARSPVDVDRDGITLTVRLTPEHERMLVLVEAWQGRRVLATGGFAMNADGTTHTPH